MNKKKQKNQNMIRPVQKDSIAEVRCEEDFVEFLRRELEWPIPYNIQKLSDVSIPHDLQRDFGFNPAEDRIAVSRLLNLTEDQPWGVFLFEFKTTKPYLSHLRKILRVLGSQKTLLKGDPIWDREDLLFICTSDWSQYQFVHFSGSKAESAVISSFGWKGPDDPFLYTLCKHNLPRLRMPELGLEGGYDADKWRSVWREAFNIKPVTDEFYKILKDVFDAVQSGISGLSGEDRRFFAELVVNRLIFLKFVEKKGWLNGDKDYLHNKFKLYGQIDYWQHFLAPLFFEGLCQEPVSRSQKTNELLGDVPFLNAELFSPSDKWNDWEVFVENRAFDLVFEKLLNPYNFTVCETSPLDIEVAFNQDLLGYGYEELIADQHGQGAYYTHPTEVNLMCRQSLWAYLENRCPEVSKETVGRLLYSELNGEHSISQPHALLLYKALHEVTVVDPALGSGTFPVAMMKHLFLALTTLGKILEGYPDYRGLIEQGALTNHHDHFDIKLHIVERSIYGCDIDYFAVQIAKLRFWIELMVDCEQPEALPNFDCKLVVGDALVSVVGTDDKGKIVTLEEHLGNPTKPSIQGEILHSIGKQAIEELGQLKHDYFNAKTVENRQTIEKQIKDKQHELLISVGIELDKITVTDKHVLWQIDFAEIFSGDNPGFDIAIANPPYIRKEEIDPLFKSINVDLNKQTLQRIFLLVNGIRISGHTDLYIYFYFRVFELLNSESGTIAFITSNSWLDVGYGYQLQEFILKHTKKFTLIEDREKRAFDNAEVNAVVSILNLGQIALKNSQAQFISLRESNTCKSTDSIVDYDYSTPQSFIKRNANCVTRGYETLRSEGIVSNNEYTGSKWGGKYLRAPDVFHETLSNYSFVNLSQVATVGTYLNTGGCDDFFFIKLHDTHGSLRLISSQISDTDKFWVEIEFITKLVRSPSLYHKPIVEPDKTDTYILRIPSDTDVGRYSVSSYIDWGVQQGFDKRSGSIGRLPWWRLPQQAYQGSHVIISRHHHDHLNILWNPDLLVANSFYSIHPLDNNVSPLILFTYLSSSLGVLIAEIFGRTNQGQGVLNTYGEDILQFPVSLNLLKHPQIPKSIIESYFYRDYKPYQIETGYSDQIDCIDHHEACPIRKEIDRFVFEAAGIPYSTGERIVLETNRIIKQRLNRASGAKYE